MDQVRFVYLLGAGASKNALPIAGELARDLGPQTGATPTFRVECELLSNEIKDSDLISAEQAAAFPKNRDLFLQAMTWAEGIARDYGGFDYFARERLLLSTPTALEEVRRLKAFISSYFVAKQALSPGDPRYRGFLSEILERDPARSTPRLPAAITIVTWNYDTQLGLALSGLGVEPDYYAQLMGGDNRSITHMNGYCGRVLNEGHGAVFTAPWILRGDGRKQALIEAFHHYAECMGPRRKLPLIRFAYEDQGVFGRNLVGEISKALSSATTLIVVGYSFPRYNRETDIMIAKALPNVDTVFVQVAPAHQSEVQGKLGELFNESPKRVRIEEVSYLDRFYVPYSLPLTPL